MKEVLLDEVDQAWANFKDTCSRYMDYLKYLRQQDPKRLTFREREALRKHGLQKKLINRLG